MGQARSPEVPPWDKEKGDSNTPCILDAKPSINYTETITDQLIDKTAVHNNMMVNQKSSVTNNQNIIQLSLQGIEHNSFADLSVALPGISSTQMVTINTSTPDLPYHTQSAEMLTAVVAAATAAVTVPSSESITKNSFTANYPNTTDITTTPIASEPMVLFPSVPINCVNSQTDMILNSKITPHNYGVDTTISASPTITCMNPSPQVSTQTTRISNASNNSSVHSSTLPSLVPSNSHSQPLVSYTLNAYHLDPGMPLYDSTIESAIPQPIEHTNSLSSFEDGNHSPGVISGHISHQSPYQDATNQNPLTLGITMDDNRPRQQRPAPIPSENAMFPSHLHRIIEDQSTNHIIEWSPNNEVVIYNFGKLLEKLNTLGMSASQADSLQKNFNDYQFARLSDRRRLRHTNEPQIQKFSHEYFLPGRPDLLHKIIRKSAMKKQKLSQVPTQQGQATRVRSQSGGSGRRRATRTTSSRYSNGRILHQSSSGRVSPYPTDITFVSSYQNQQRPMHLPPQLQPQLPQLQFIPPQHLPIPTRSTETLRTPLNLSSESPTDISFSTSPDQLGFPISQTFQEPARTLSTIMVSESPTHDFHFQQTVRPHNNIYHPSTNQAYQTYNSFNQLHDLGVTDLAYQGLTTTYQSQPFQYGQQMQPSPYINNQPSLQHDNSSVSISQLTTANIQPQNNMAYPYTNDQEQYNHNS